MIHDVVVPKWGLTEDEVTLVQWLCVVGDEVTEGQALAELEADKTNGELESPVAGVVEALLASRGETLAPGQVVARVRTA